MVNFETIKAKLETLLSGVNEETGASDTNLTAAVARLREKFSGLKSSTEAELAELNDLIGGDG